MPTAEQLYDEALELKESGRLDEAIGKLEALIGVHPDYALAHAALSVFYSRLENHERAVQHAQRVCELDPDDAFSFTSMSLICQKAGLRAEAEQAMAQAMEKQWAAMRTARKDSDA